MTFNAFKPKKTMSRTAVPPGGLMGDTLSGSPAYNEGSRLRVQAVSRQTMNRRALGLDQGFKMRERGWSSSPRYASVESTFTRPGGSRREMEEEEKILDTRVEGTDVSKGGNREAARSRFRERLLAGYRKKLIKPVGNTVAGANEPTQTKQAGR